MASLRLALADGAVIAKRNLIKVKRVPDVLVFTTLSPIMFVLLFAYVFGNLIDVPGELPRVPHRGDLRPDRRVRGHVHGRRARRGHPEGDHRPVPVLPMAPSAVLVGRTTSDVLYNVISIAIMSITGLLVRWRIRGSVLEALAASCSCSSSPTPSRG